MVKVDRDNYNKLNTFQQVDKIISRVATSTEKQDTSEPLTW